MYGIEQGFELINDTSYGFVEYKGPSFSPICFVKTKIGYRSILIGNDNFSIKSFDINRFISGIEFGIEAMLGFRYIVDNKYFTEIKVKADRSRIFIDNNYDVFDVKAGLEFFILGQDLKYNYQMINHIIFHDIGICINYKKMFIFLPEKINAQGFEIGLKTNFTPF